MTDADFAVRVACDSMAPVFLTGDIVYCAAADAVPDGSIAAVLIDGMCTFKRIYRAARGFILECEDSTFPPIRVTPPELEIIGRPVGLERSFA